MLLRITRLIAVIVVGNNFIPETTVLEKNDASTCGVFARMKRLGIWRQNDLSEQAAELSSQNAPRRSTARKAAHNVGLQAN
jgi:hypothetical protein